MTMADYSYLGSGKVYMKQYGTAEGFKFIGNVSALSLAVNEEVKELKDYTQTGGGTYNEVRRINSVEMTLTGHDFSPDNLARALYGSTTATATGTVTNEAATSYKDALVPLAHLPSAITAVTGTGGTPVYTAGTDYELTEAGLYIPAASTINNGTAIEVDYTRADYDMVQALVSSGKEYQLVFEGLNEARSGKATVVTIHRARVGAARNLGLIGEDFGALEVTGKLLKDTGITTAGLSQYFKVAIAK
jgi:hypothetical protein